ncbi:MobC domain-containing protein [Rhodovulum strictum]|uniref:Plasmid mobilization relaxosome protein MobC n=1 Tax=Rhodovulum strictum TaxID=58314 RepID=A0A844BBA8_9RHOB|nr:plasmid mobilization relaxosome protein MobC [Rhodovulum strictum]MRH22870.1 plasmid mobilization relaxosome protein MobC [Rhodovulum strictum]
MSGGFLEFSRADSDALEGLHRELHRIGVDVNQVAHAANRGRVDLVRGHWEALTELRRALPRVCMLLLQIIHERRRRGVELFRTQVAATGTEGADG